MQCNKCGCGTLQKHDKDLVVSAWNTRVIDSDVSAMQKHIQELIDKLAHYEELEEKGKCPNRRQKGCEH